MDKYVLYKHGVTIETEDFFDGITKDDVDEFIYNNVYQCNYPPREFATLREARAAAEYSIEPDFFEEKLKSIHLMCDCVALAIYNDEGDCEHVRLLEYPYLREMTGEIMEIYETHKEKGLLCSRTEVLEEIKAKLEMRGR